MKNRVFLFIIIIISAVFTSCQKDKNIFIGDIKYIKSFPLSESINGTIVNIDNPGIAKINVIDSFIVLVGYSSPFYQVYSKYNHTHLGKFIQQGRAANELESLEYPICYRKTSTGTKVLFYDEARSKIKSLNITKSVENKKTILDTNFLDVKSIPNLKTISLINDSLFFVHAIDIPSEGEYYTLFDKNADKFILKETINTKKLSNIGKIFIFNTSNTLMNERSMHVAAMQFFNQINFYNVKTKQSFSVVPGSKSTVIEEVEQTPMPEKIEYYQDLATTESQVWAVYANCTRQTWATDPNFKSVIHVLNWDGDPIIKLSLSEKIAKIALDEERKILYGVTLDEEILEYDVKHILK